MQYKRTISKRSGTNVYTTLVMLLFLFSSVSCDDMYEKTRDINQPPNVRDVSAFYVLSEGLFNMNNSTLAKFDMTTGVLNKNFFLDKNRRGLGDTANDIAIYGSKLYIVVNVSSQVEVLDARTGVSLRQIPMFQPNGLSRQPRYMAFHDGKVFVCSFDGTVAKIDTATLQIEAIINVGRNPDGICVSNGKLYVSNSGGLSFPNYDNTVSVIDIASFTEIKRIEVAPNPSHIRADSEGDVYVVSRGDYGETGYQFQRIDSKTDQVVEVFEGLNVFNFTIHNDTAYLYSYDFTTGNSWFKVFDCKTEKVIAENFITDQTVIQTPYGINVNPHNGDVYITDAKSFIMWGDLLIFNRHGQLQSRINEIGLNPNKVVFLNK